MKVLAPRCPGCQTPPVTGFGATVFCGNDECTVFSWDIYVDPAEQLASAHVIDLGPDWLPPTGDAPP